MPGTLLTECTDGWLCFEILPPVVSKRLLRSVPLTPLHLFHLLVLILLYVCVPRFCLHSPKNNLGL